MHVAQTARHASWSSAAVSFHGHILSHRHPCVSPAAAWRSHTVLPPVCVAVHGGLSLHAVGVCAALRRPRSKLQSSYGGFRAISGSKTGCQLPGESSCAAVRAGAWTALRRPRRARRQNLFPPPVPLRPSLQTIWSRAGLEQECKALAMRANKCEIDSGFFARACITRLLPRAHEHR